MQRQRHRVSALRCRAQLCVAAVFMAAALFFPPEPACAAESFQIGVPTAILIEPVSGTVLTEKAADTPTPPSSMSKLMTLAVVFEELRQGRLKLDDEFQISVHAWRTGGAPSGGSTMFAPVNSKVKVQDLIKAAIIQSANDAAIALAEGIAGTESEFARKMTQRARAIGLPNATFANPTGLPAANQRMSVRELAILTKHIITEFPEFYPIFSEKEFTWNNIRQTNRNALLNAGIGADGLKTGSTKDGGYGVVGSAVQGGQRLIVVVNGAKTDKERFEEARKILEWGFHSFESRLLYNPNEVVGEAKVFGGERTSVELIAGARPVVLIAPRVTTERLTAKITYSGPIKAPVAKGQAIGSLQVHGSDRVLLEIPLMAASDVPVGSLHRRALDAMTEWATGLMRRAIGRS